MRIDELDQRIVASLIADARSSYAEIGAAVSLSAPAVKRRVDRLRAAGVIKGFTAVVDPAAVGWSTEAFVELYCVGRTSPAQIAEAAGRYPEVVAAYTVSGQADALVHLRAADIGHLEQALERLRAEPFVSSTRSTIVLSRLAESGARLPGSVLRPPGAGPRPSAGALRPPASVLGRPGAALAPPGAVPRLPGTATRPPPSKPT